MWLFVGVNGVGKTTTIGKLALREAQAGRTVLPLQATRSEPPPESSSSHGPNGPGARIVKGADGADPSSVIFDAVQSAASRGAGLVLADTAGACTPR